MAAQDPIRRISRKVEPIDPGFFICASLNMLIKLMIHDIYTSISITGSYKSFFI